MSKKTKKHERIVNFLIVKCYPLNDQYECDCHREPICVTKDTSKYGDKYEVYAIYEDGRIKLIREQNIC